MADNSNMALSGGESPQPKGKKRSKWLIWGAIVTLVVLIVVGVTVGVVVSKNKKNDSASSTSGSSNSTTGGSSGGGGSTGSGGNSGGGGGKDDDDVDPNDPSKFAKDPALHQAFYGMAYTPEGSQVPECGNSLDAVIKDIQIISQLTKRIRLYGSDCNQTALVLEAITRTKVDMQVWLGNYAMPDDDGEAYRRQRDLIRDAILTYGTDHIGGITVGNEFILNYVIQNGGDSPDADAAIGNAGAAILVADIEDTRTMLAGMNLPKTIPVGNSDAGAFFNSRVLAAIDYGMSNVHPWFANTTVEASAQWTFDFFKEYNTDVAAALPNRPMMYIAETGWPTASSDLANANNGASAASVPNLQVFLDTFVCQANANGTPYFYFEFVDEKWKEELYGGVEGFWGLFTGDRKLKPGITIPTCTSP